MQFRSVTTSKVVGNAESVADAIRRIEKNLLDTHGITLEVEAISGEACVTNPLLEFNSLSSRHREIFTTAGIRERSFWGPCYS